MKWTIGRCGEMIPNCGHQDSGLCYTKRLPGFLLLWLASVRVLWGTVGEGRLVSILGHWYLPFINDGWSLGKDHCHPMQKMQAPLPSVIEFHRMPQDHLRKIPQDDKTIQSQWCCSAVQYLFAVCETLEGIETASHSLVNQYRITIIKLSKDKTLLSQSCPKGWQWHVS